MRNIGLLTLAATVTAIFAAVPLSTVRAQNLVSNPSFETPDLPSGDGLRNPISPPSDWDIFPDGTTAGLDWNVEWVDGGTAGNLEIQSNAVNLGGAQDGDQYAELDTDSVPVGGTNRSSELVSIFQSVNTCALSQYELSYWYRPRPNVGPTQGMDVEFGGSPVRVHSTSITASPTTWQQFTSTESPSGGTSSELRFTETGAADQLGSFLDNVSLTVTPGTADACDVLDIKPQSFPNAVNLCRGNGTIPIAIVGSADLDPLFYDVKSITIAGNELEVIGRGKSEDCVEEDVVNGTQTETDPGTPDGQDDFVCHLDASELAGFVDGTDTELQMCVTFTDGVDEIQICDTDSVKLTKTDCLD